MNTDLVMCMRFITLACLKIMIVVQKAQSLQAYCSLYSVYRLMM